MDLDVLLFASGIGLILVTSILAFFSRPLPQIREWLHGFETAGVTDVVVDGPFWQRDGISGRLGGRRLHVSVMVRSDGQVLQTRVRIFIEGDSGISLRPETNDPEPVFLPAAREVEIGDDTFDSAFFVQGPIDRLRAVLDADTRALLLQVIRGRVRYGPDPADTMWAEVSLRNGDLHAEFIERAVDIKRNNLPGILETLHAVVERLSPPASIVSRLLQNTAREPNVWLRLENLLLLARSYPKHPAVPQVLRRALHDESPIVQLEAALALGGEDADRVLTEIATSETADDTLSARAIAGLGARLGGERLRDVLSHALRTRRLCTARAALEALGRFGGPAAVPVLARVLAVETALLAVSTAAALAETGAAEAEGPLLTALARGPVEVRVAVATALGHVGSARAVPTLKDAAAQGGPLRRAAREAVAAIQSRLQGASPGQLSLAESDAGRLTLADADPKGQVSLADEPSRGDSGPARTTPPGR